MARTQVASRPDALARELAGFGLPSSHARHLSAELVLQHPLVFRMGVQRTARNLIASGLPPEVAREAAALLFALDALDLGLRFDRVIEALRVAGIEHAVAQAAAIDAARVQRASRLEDPRRPAALPLAPIAVAIAAMLAAAGVAVLLL